MLVHRAMVSSPSIENRSIYNSLNIMPIVSAAWLIIIFIWMN